LQRGQALFAAKQYAAALEKFQFAVRNDPGSAAAYFWQGQALAQLGRDQEALQSLKKAQQLDPGLRFTEKKAFQELLQKLQGKGAPGPAQPPSPPPAAPQPPRWPYGWIGGGVAGGLAVLWAIHTLLRRARDKGHLALHHSASQEFYRQVADGLTRARRSLQARPNPTAEARVEAAELAFFEALEMLAQADREDTSDLPRVRRARALLEKAQEELQALSSWGLEEAEAPAAWGCYFCSKPLSDREEGDLLALQKGGETRQVLICRGCSRRCRQKNVPPVRVVPGPNGFQHWATAPDYDPCYDFYHDDRYGRETRPLSELPEPFITPAAAARVFVEGGRPDHILRLEDPQPDGS